MPQPSKIMASMSLLFNIFPRSCPVKKKVWPSWIQHSIRLQRLWSRNVLRYLEDILERRQRISQLVGNLVHDRSNQLWWQSHWQLGQDMLVDNAQKMHHSGTYRLRQVLLLWKLILLLSELCNTWRFPNDNR